VLGQAKLLAHRPDLVLEQVAQRLDELEVEALGELDEVVVALDRGRRPPVPPDSTTSG
jgi:putative heme iron utilization protein